MMCSNTEADFVSSGLEETMLVSWENVRCTATQMVKELCYAAFSLEKNNMMWKNKFFL